MTCRGVVALSNSEEPNRYIRCTKNRQVGFSLPLQYKNSGRYTEVVVIPTV